MPFGLGTTTRDPPVLVRQRGYEHWLSDAVGRCGQCTQVKM
jgi:hypothetical protein